MKSHTRFKRNLLASAVAGCTLAGLGQLAIAQEGVDTEDVSMLEEVIVLGVRGAQESAIGTKRDATSIVDGISAEDVGKLPDTTITDSLQRITGVQIERSAGEGANLSIRGMQQVAVMLNGEQFLAAGNLYSAQPNFNDIPAQLLRSATVYKSLDVSNSVSGITGTIDLETYRPMDFDEGFTFAGGYDASYGDISQTVDSTVNALVSWRNENIGFMVSAVTGQKNLANDYAGLVGDPQAWEMGPGSDFDGQWVTTTSHGMEFFSAEDERNREGLNASLQANLGDSLELVMEGFYTDAKQYQRRQGLNMSNRWQGQGATSEYRQSLWDPRYSDPNAWYGAQIASPTSASDTVTGADGRNWIVADGYNMEPLWVYSLTSNRIIDTKSENYNIELNWDNGGRLTGGIRVAIAEAENNSLFPTMQGGINSFRGNTVQQLHGHFYPDEIIDEYGLTLDPDRLDEVGVNGGRYVLPNPLGYDEDPELDMTMDGHHRYFSGFDRPIAGGLGDGATLADYMGNRDSWVVEGLQMEINNDTSSSLHSYSGHLNYRFDDDFFIKDVEVGVRSSERMVDKYDFDTWAQFYVGSDNRLTIQNDAAVNNVGCYAQWRSIDQKFDGGGQWDECSAGEQLVGMEDDPAGFVPYFVLPPQPMDYHGLDMELVTDLGGYTSGIPDFWAVDPESLDNAREFQEKAFGDTQDIVRPGTSYTININDLSAYIKGNFEFGIISGNFGLRALETEIIANVYETTPDTRTYGGSVYYTGRKIESKKDTYLLPSLNMQIAITDDFILRLAAAKNKQDLDLDRYGSSLQVFTGPDPDDATQRIPSGWNSTGNINLEPWETTNYDISAEYYIGEASMVSAGAFLVEIESFVENTTTTRDIEWNGEVYTLEGTGPVVGEGGEVKGIELSAKIALSDFLDGDSFLSNFGIDANYTYSPSERPGMASDVTGSEYPFANNSEHTYNLIGWYQKDRWQARIALNGRSERFIQEYGGEYGFATYAPDESYLDANVSYDVLDNITVYVQGSNLTGTDYKQVYRLADGVEQPAFVYENEARYSLGVRAKF